MEMRQRSGCVERRVAAVLQQGHFLAVGLDGYFLAVAELEFVHRVNGGFLGFQVELGVGADDIGGAMAGASAA